MLLFHIAFFHRPLNASASDQHGHDLIFSHFELRCVHKHFFNRQRFDQYIKLLDVSNVSLQKSGRRSLIPVENDAFCLPLCLSTRKDIHQCRFPTARGSNLQRAIVSIVTAIEPSAAPMRPSDRKQSTLSHLSAVLTDGLSSWRTLWYTVDPVHPPPITPDDVFDYLTFMTICSPVESDGRASRFDDSASQRRGCAAEVVHI